MRRLLPEGAWAALTLVCLGGCGRKGPPVPPENLLPAAVADLAAVARPEGVLLRWRGPSTRSDGSPLDDLSSYRVVRVAEAPAGGSRVVEIPAAGPSPVAWLDPSPPPPTRYLYRVVALNRAGDPGDAPPPVRAAAGGPFPPPPSGVRAQPGIGSSTLRWERPPALQERGAILYNVYRMGPEIPPDGTPLNPRPIEATGYVDTGLEVHRPVRYRVRSIVASGGLSTESLPSPDLLLVPLSPDAPPR